MKQYTLYEAIKYSEGKLTRNKLEKAIKKGDIMAQKGTGKAKYLIDEDELFKYLQEQGDALVKKSLDLKEAQANSKKELKNDYISLLLKEKETVIQLKDEKIQYMEAQQERYLPKLDEENSKETERKQLLMELSGISIFRRKRKQEILSRLIKLS